MFSKKKKRIKVPKGKDHFLDQCEFDYWDLKDIESIWVIFDGEEVLVKLRYSFGAYQFPLNWLDNCSAKIVMKNVDIVYI